MSGYQNLTVNGSIPLKGQIQLPSELRMIEK